MGLVAINLIVEWLQLFKKRMWFVRVHFLENFKFLSGNWLVFLFDFGVESGILPQLFSDDNINVLK